CGMVRSKDGRSIPLAASGGGGHIYQFNIATETLADRGTLGAVDWHSFNMVPNGTIGFGTVPNGDELRLIELRGDRASTLAAVSVQPTPAEGTTNPTTWASPATSCRLAPRVGQVRGREFPQANGELPQRSPRGRVDQPGQLHGLRGPQRGHSELDPQRLSW